MSTSQILRDAAALVRDPKIVAEIRKWADTIDACSPERQQAVIAALAEQEIALRPLCPSDRDRWAILAHATAYDLAHRSAQISARLVLGETPAQITGLTKAEAHAYLSDRRYGIGIESPASWLTVKAGIWNLPDGAAASNRYAYPVRTVKIARWLIAVLQDRPRRDALLRNRNERGPHGEAIEGAFISRLDELRDPDLRPSVDETFERAARRMWRASERAMAKKQAPLTVAPRWWKPARCARLLLSGADLIAEGRDMHHCAATYAGYVARGDSVIVSLRVPYYPYVKRTPSRDRLDFVLLFRRDLDVRSTVEIDRKTIQVRQHKGPHNAAPHPLCERALAVLLRRWLYSATWVQRQSPYDPPYDDPPYDDPDADCPF
jgi:hypothetical protein